MITKLWREIKKVIILLVSLITGFLVVGYFLLSNLNNFNEISKTLNILQRFDNNFQKKERIELNNFTWEKISINIPSINNWLVEKKLWDLLKIYISNLNILQWNFASWLDILSPEDELQSFNIATTKLLRWHNLAKEKTLTWLQEADKQLQDSLDFYELTEKLTNEDKLLQINSHNQKIASQLSLLVLVMRCQKELTTIRSQLELINRQLRYLSILLDQENALLENAKQQKHACIDQHKQSVKSIIWWIWKITEDIQKIYMDFANKSIKIAENPSSCIFRTDPVFFKTLDNSVEFINNLTRKHEDNLSKLKSWSDFTAEDCKSQEWDSIKYSQNMQELMDNIQRQEDKKQFEQNTWSTTKESYKNLPDQRKDLLEKSEQTNQKRIYDSQQILSDPNYSPNKYIKDIFIEFYWNEELK